MSHVQTKNPFTLRTLHEYPIEEAPLERLKKSQEVQQKWAKLKVGDRVALLRQSIEYFHAEKDSISRSITEHVGKPLAQSKGEVSAMIDRAEFLLKTAPEVLVDDVFPDQEGVYRAMVREPHGVVFVISAWNYPLLITINGLLAALLAGNAVILKHSSRTLGIGKIFSQAFGNLPGWEYLVQDLVLTHSQTSKMIQEMPLDYVIFTGSVEGGRIINRDAAHQFLPCQLELGGKDAAYVHQDAELLYAVESLVEGALYNAGQSCCGIERVYVHEDCYEEFIEEARKRVSSYQLGDPFMETTTMGPLANPSSAEHLLAQVNEGVAMGARLLLGGKPKRVQGAVFFEPTLIIDVPQDSRLMQEENFGPILSLARVKNEQQAMEYINDSNYGLSCALYTQDQDQALRWSQEIEAGTIFMNRCDYLDPALAWTGYKNSGKGSGLSSYTFHSLTKLKSINFKKVESNESNESN